MPMFPSDEPQNSSLLAAARSLKQLGTLLRGRVPILRAVTVTAAEASDPVVRMALEAVARDVEAGNSVWRAFAGQELLSPSALELLRTAEEEGALDTELTLIAEYIAEQHGAATAPPPQRARDDVLVELDAAANALAHEHALPLAPPSADAQAATPEARAAARLAAALIGRAAAVEAEELHIDPRPTQTLVRCRVDGALREVLVLSPEAGRLLAAAMRSASGAQAGGRTAAYEGLLRVEREDLPVQATVASASSPHGEKVTAEFLPPGRRLDRLDGLGLLTTELGRLEESLHRRKGLVVIAGHEGKGAMLGAILAEVSSPEVNTIALDLSVTGWLPPHVTTLRVPRRRSAPASGIQAAMRHSPDVLVAGSLADPAVAQACVGAARDGMLVLGWLTVDSAQDAVARLLKGGMPREELLSTLACIVVCALARGVCPRCAASWPATAADLRGLELPVPLPEPFAVRRGAGCPSCRSTGYRGYVGVYQVLNCQSDNPSHHLVGLEGNPSGLLNNPDGRSLSQVACIKVLQGETSPEEALRVVQSRTTR